MNNLHTVQEVQRGAAASAERAHKMEAANEGNRSRRLVSTSPSCWSRAVRVGLVTLLGSVSLTKALAEGKQVHAAYAHQSYIAMLQSCLAETGGSMD